MRSSAPQLILAGLAIMSSVLHAAEPVRVFAAASLTNALDDIAARWQNAGHPALVLAYAGSSTLARQIEAGSPADVFASADLTWMDYLQKRGRIVRETCVNLLGNELVLIVPKGERLPIEIKPGFDIASAFKGKLCTGESGVVPVGSYAKQSLQALGWWKPLT